MKSCVPEFLPPPLFPTLEPKYHLTKISHSRGHWAGISGSLENTDPTPLFRALTEVQEETQLTQNEVELVRGGKPFSFIASKYKTQWTVHPFLFKLKDPTGQNIEINWEHSDYRWVSTQEFYQLKAQKDSCIVPKLEVSIKRVLLQPVVSQGLVALKNDLVSGARQLAAKAVRILRDYVADDETLAGGKEELWRGLLNVGWQISVFGRPSMAAAIEGIILETLQEIGKEWDALSPGIQITSLRDAVVKVIEKKERQANESVLEQLCNNFIQCIKGHIQKTGDPSIRIMTICHSSTVEACLVSLSKLSLNPKPKVLILESRPLFTGITHIKAIQRVLQREGQPLNLSFETAADASMGYFARESTYLLLGADWISPSGDVSNKVGSLPAALCAQHFGNVKVVCVSYTSKIAETSGDQHLEENDPEQLISSWNGEDAPPQTKVRNWYFEWVDQKLIDCYLTELGLLDASAVACIARTKKELKDSLFSQLEHC